MSSNRSFGRVAISAAALNLVFLLAGPALPLEIPNLRSHGPSNPSTRAPLPPDPWPSTPSPGSGPQYFTYWDLNDTRSYNALGDVQTEINLVTIAENMNGGPDTPAWAAFNANQLQDLIAYDTAALAQAQSLNKKAWVAIEYVCYYFACQEYSNWEARLNLFLDAISPYADAIAAIYLFDEPYESALINGVPASRMTSQLTAIAAVVRSRLPNAALPVVCQSYTLSNRLDLSTFDWCGFDAYGASPVKLNEFTDRLESMMFSYDQAELASGETPRHRMLMFIPYAYMPATSTDSTPTESVINDLLAQQQVYARLAAEPHIYPIAAVISFLYNSQPGLCGLDQMPTVHAAYESWYAELAGAPNAS